MDNKKKAVKMILGFVLIALALLADKIGIGASEGMAWKQITALVIGVLLLVCSCKCCGTCAPKK